LAVRIGRPRPDFAQVSVTDTGLGIDPDNLQRIFNYGFTTKHHGNGFGLHSAANAMAEMGGSIAAHSEGQGLGATFTIEFPLAAAIQEADDEAAVQETDDEAAECEAVCV
jgi:signal transduction histidine kinase